MTYKLLEKNIEKQILSDKDAMIFLTFHSLWYLNICHLCFSCLIKIQSVA